MSRSFNLSTCPLPYYVFLGCFCFTLLSQSLSLHHLLQFDDLTDGLVALFFTAIWSHSCMDFMHYLRETSASPLCGTSGSLPTWSCWGKLWFLESACLSNYTRWDLAALMPFTSVSGSQPNISLHLRITLHLRTSMTNPQFCSKPSPPTSRILWLLTKATPPGGAPCCLTPLRSSPCATSSTKEPTSTKSSCSTDAISAFASSRWELKRVTFCYL